MSTVLPPLNALRAFEATARHLSFTRAAEELHVTPAALSHQIKGLEEFLGVRLFHRRTRAIDLTDAGMLIYPGLHAAFLQMRQAVGALDRLRNDKVLVVSAAPGFTAKWLAPRLYRFMATAPDIDARISSTFAVVDFDAAGVDVAIRNIRDQAPPPADLYVEKLVDLVLAPLCSPRLLEGLPPIEGPADIRRFNLIHDDSLVGRPDIADWGDWLTEAKVSNFDHSRGMRFSSADHVIDAAVEGAGLMLGAGILAHDELRSGRLVMPFGPVLKTNRAFYFVCPRGTEQRPKVKLFRDWIVGEIERLDPALTFTGELRTKTRSGRGKRL